MAKTTTQASGPTSQAGAAARQAGADPAADQGAEPALTHPMLADDAASAWLGIEVDRADYGHARIRMRVRAEMVNGFDIAHGGMVFAFADSAFAMACNDPHGDGSTITVASGADVNFVGSARRGQELTATATVRAQAGRNGLYDIQVTDDDGRIVAEFRGRSRTIPNPARPPSKGPADGTPDGQADGPPEGQAGPATTPNDAERH